MAQIYTENQILRLVYGECDLFDRLETEFAMEDCPRLLHLYDDMREMKAEMPTFSKSPSTHVVNNILAYSSLSAASY
jgi:hypothetical protein